jgi:hypothetical protein
MHLRFTYLRSNYPENALPERDGVTHVAGIEQMSLAEGEGFVHARGERERAAA